MRQTTFPQPAGAGFGLVLACVLLLPLPADAEENEALPHWSLTPLARPQPPAVARTGWPKNAIDQFVLAALEARQLRPSPQADRRTLIRRLSFDLTGLPPSPEAVERFLADTRPDAYPRLVDELLASPHHGERWARHWLDVVHFADTHGFERDRKRPHAWRYRDYVVGAFNDDKPYDQFIREQIAGDVLTPGNTAATGFLGAGPWDFVGHEETKNPVLNRKARADELDDIVATVSSATLALTVNCARCHDHKFDPILQRDYYQLAAVFAGVKRGDRVIEDGPRATLEKQLAAIESKRIRLEGDSLGLADIVGGGDGSGNARNGKAIGVRRGGIVDGKTGHLKDLVVNRFVPSPLDLIDGVFIPDGKESPIAISTTGLTVGELPPTSGASWDHIQNGPVTSQDFTALNGTDFTSPGHRMLGLHANKGITFDLDAIRERHAAFRNQPLRFRSQVGYGGKAGGEEGADFWIFVDGELRAKRRHLTAATGGVSLNLQIARGERFLTLVSTDGGNGISYDQIFFGDPRLLRPAENPAAQKNDLAALAAKADDLRAQIGRLPTGGGVEKCYAVTPIAPQPTRLLDRGDPESPGAEVAPGALSAIALQFPDIDQNAPEGERRRALAEWVVDPQNPLVRRVIVNRLWHYHFGQGIVSTPSDFGTMGSAPSHPQLLDWLAEKFARDGWSLKAMHRLIVNSATYRQSSQIDPAAARIDSGNRLLWRMNRRRLEAEAIRDAVLAVSGKLEPQLGGPAFEDFKFIDKYAPVYQHLTHDRPEFWRRSLYRFTVRSVPNAFMDVFDCPNPSTLTPVRNQTTTSLQSLSLLNNPFILQQARFFAERAQREAGAASVDDQIQRAYRLAFSRPADPDELALCRDLVTAHGLAALCRVIFNTSEFLYVD